MVLALFEECHAILNLILRSRLFSHRGLASKEAIIARICART